MLKALLGIVIEMLLAAAIAGLLLAVAVPVLTRTNVVGANDVPTKVVITGVLVAAVMIALVRPGSAIRRHMKR